MKAGDVVMTGAVALLKAGTFTSGYSLTIRFGEKEKEKEGVKVAEVAEVGGGRGFALAR